MPSLHRRLEAIEALVLDVDGVLTDGRIIYSDAGSELQSFHVRDGSGIALWRRMGKRVAVITGRGSTALERRAAELGMAPLVMRVRDKASALSAVMSEMNLRPDEIAAIGDDLPDISILTQVGVAIAVADACPEVRGAADYTTTAPGGRGAVREAIEWILKAQGSWARALESYHPGNLAATH